MFKALGSILMLATLTFSQYSVEFKTDADDLPGDGQICKALKITNTSSSTLDLYGISINYYIWENQLNVDNLAWRNDWCQIGNTIDCADAYKITFSALDTNFYGTKRANKMITISFNRGYNLMANQTAEIHFGVYRNDWGYEFDETRHWSYMSNTSFVNNPNIVAMYGENIVNGTYPPQNKPSNPSRLYPKDCTAGRDMIIDGKVLSENLSKDASGNKIGTDLTLKHSYVEQNHYYGTDSLVKSYLSAEELNIMHVTNGAGGVNVARSLITPHKVQSDSLVVLTNIENYGNMKFIHSADTSLNIKLDSGQITTGKLRGTMSGVFGEKLTINKEKVYLQDLVGTDNTVTTVKAGEIEIKSNTSSQTFTTTLKSKEIDSPKLITKRLEVNGTVNSGSINADGIVRCKEVIVTNNNWPDYVFTNSHDLKDLSEVESYIKANGHLEGIPSATKVHSGGVSMGKIQASLLEKVEELTLYCIELNKEITRLKEGK